MGRGLKRFPCVAAHCISIVALLLVLMHRFGTVWMGEYGEDFDFTIVNELWVVMLLVTISTLFGILYFFVHNGGVGRVQLRRLGEVARLKLFSRRKAERLHLCMLGLCVLYLAVRLADPIITIDLPFHFLKQMYYAVQRNFISFCNDYFRYNTISNVLDYKVGICVTTTMTYLLLMFIVFCLMQSLFMVRKKEHVQQ